MAALTKQEDGIKCTISEISQAIDDLKKYLNLMMTGLSLHIYPKNVEFKQLPSKLTVSSSIFTSQNINQEQLDKQFGYVSLPSI